MKLTSSYMYIWIRRFDTHYQILKLKKLNQLHKKFLKQAMHIHERTADLAVYLASGVGSTQVSFGYFMKCALQ